MFTKYSKEKKESKPLEKIQMKHLILAFLVLGVGCFVALLIFLTEMIAKKTNKKNSRKTTAKFKN